MNTINAQKYNPINNSTKGKSFQNIQILKS